MLISLNWIKDFVELPQKTPNEFAQDFTCVTAEVEEATLKGEHLKQITVAEVLSTRQHPEADKLSLVTFKTGTETKEVVCGAPNVRQGLKVAYAPTGTTLPNGLTLEAKKIRGFLSEGMLCSPAELEIGEDAAGIWELPPEAPVGAILLEYLEEELDIVLDIDNKSLTHRPDLWGHYGLAREFAAIYEKELKNPYADKWVQKLESTFTSEASPIVPVIEEGTCCLGYWGISVKNVQIKESPQWMQKRLLATGLRPINNMVDIGNYVMLETGGPLHIFDKDRIAGEQIIIKALSKPAKLNMLDESVAELIPGDTVVADADNPLVIGGIMGGESSGVSDETHTIFIEAANWDPASIRRTSTRIGLRTDSSIRFEKSLDSHLVKRTILRALELVLELCPEAQVIGKLEYAGPDLSKDKALVLQTSQEKVSSLLGKEVSKDRIISILNTLDFEATENGAAIDVKVPTFRATRDIEREADLIEEVGRVVGYGNIEAKSALSPMQPLRISKAKSLQRAIQDFMVLSARALEIISYPTTGVALLSKACWQEENEELKLLNALSVEHDRMRPTLIPALLQSVALNQKNYSSFRLFELGRAYFPDKKDFSTEHNQLAVGFFDKQANTYLALANVIENLLAYLSLPGKLANHNAKEKNNIIPQDWAGRHPHEYQHIKVMGKNAGAITSVHPLVLRKFKIKGNLAIAVLDIHNVEERGVQDLSDYNPLPKYPSSAFDCTVVVKAKTQVDEVLNALRKLKIKEMTTSKIVDVFASTPEENFITVRTTFADPDKTLSGEFIKECEDKVVKVLADNGYPLKQG